MKRQRTFWMDDKDFELIKQKIQENGFSGKGQLERFMEKIAKHKIIFVQGSGKIIISVE